MEGGVLVEPKAETSTRATAEARAKANAVVEARTNIQDQEVAKKADVEVPVKATFEIGSTGATGVEVGVAHISKVRPDLHTHQIPNLTIRPPFHPQSAPPHFPWVMPMPMPMPAPHFHPVPGYPHPPLMPGFVPFVPNARQSGTFPSSPLGGSAPRSPPIRINSLDGTPLKFDKAAPASPPASTRVDRRPGRVPKSPTIQVRLETQEQKIARLSKAKDEEESREQKVRGIREREERAERESTGVEGEDALGAQTNPRVGADFAGDEQDMISSPGFSDSATVHSWQDGVPSSPPSVPARKWRALQAATPAEENAEHKEFTNAASVAAASEARILEETDIGIRVRVSLSIRR